MTDSAGKKNKSKARNKKKSPKDDPEEEQQSLLSRQGQCQGSDKFERNSQDLEDVNHSLHAQPACTSQEDIESIYEWVDDKDN